MNKRRLAAIAKWLEAGAPHKKGVEGFDMQKFQCGTTCCIAGAANRWWHPLGNEKMDYSEYFPLAVRAADVLGLTNKQAEGLFGIDAPEYVQHAKPAKAARVIRHLIETGRVAWKSA